MQFGPPGIGTLGEKPLHASLKRWYAAPGDQIEVPFEGYVIDLVREDLLIEIQTRSFSSMKSKLTKLLDGGHRVRIVHPIAIDRWIVKVDGAGDLVSRRRSPKHGSALDIFSELVSFPDLIVRKELELELVLVEEDEIRQHRIDGPWRRNGWAVVERRLVEVVETLRIATPRDLASLLPAGLGETFTTSGLASASGRPLRLVQQMAYCLRKAGAIETVGKVGKAVEYRLCAGERT
ncbi:MAG TPA: hypothetical protein VIW94_04310 [Acidimicrobiia bacterium]